MKKYTKKELTKMLEDIKAGTVYTSIEKGRGGIGYIKLSCTGKYIEYNHFGTSARRVSVDDLQWIIDVIFMKADKITPAYYSEYHLNYIPINEQCEHIDFSIMHPNVYGK